MQSSRRSLSSSSSSLHPASTAAASSSGSRKVRSSSENIGNQAAKRHQPYDTSKRRKAVKGKAPATQRTIATSAAKRPATLRDAFLQTIHEEFPDFVPRSDFDIMMIGNRSYDGKGPVQSMYEWLDAEYVDRVEDAGGEQDLNAIIRKVLRTRTQNGTGEKPVSGSPNVFIRAIPRSEYSIRLFPGSPARSEYCMDFVRTQTGEAVNSPFFFELWSVSSSLGPCVQSRIHSLESVFGIPQNEIRAGAEKFVLQDGMTYVLRRPGHKQFQFRVPIRMSPLPPSENADVADLPFMV